MGKDIGVGEGGYWGAGRTLGLEQGGIAFGARRDIGVGARKVSGGGNVDWSRGTLALQRRASHWRGVWGLCFGAGGQRTAGTPSWDCVGFCRAVPRSVQQEVSGERLRWFGCGRNVVWRKLNPGEKTL